MNPIIIPGEQGTDAWREAKAGVITGTRFASVMAKKDTAAYQNLIVDLAWERVFGPVEDERFVSKAMQDGIDREPESIDWYRFHTEADCYQPMFVVHGEHGFIGCSPDLLADVDGMAQIKNPGRRAHLEVMQKRSLPSQYRWQVQGELMVCQRDWSDFVSYIPQLGGECVRILPSAEDHKALMRECLAVNDAANELAEKIRNRRIAE